MHPEPFKRGFSEFALLRVLLDAMEYQYVNEFAYSSARPVTDDEVPRRFQQAEEVWERQLWRDQLREWDQHVKPESIRTHRELQSVDRRALRRRARRLPDALSRSALRDDLPAHALHGRGDALGG